MKNKYPNLGIITQNHYSDDDEMRIQNNHCNTTTTQTYTYKGRTLDVLNSEPHNTHRKKRETQKAHNLQTGKLARVLFFLCQINILMWTHHRRYPLYIPEDEYHFKMNNQGTSDQNPIALDNVDENNVSTPPPATERFIPTEQMAIDAQAAVDSQQRKLAMYNDEAYRKKANAVTPGEREVNKRLKIKLEDDDHPLKRKVLVIETTKHITDENGEVTTVKTTEEVTRPPSKQATSLQQSQSNLSVYGFTGPDPKNSKVIPIYEAKVVKKKNQEIGASEINNTLKGLDYVAVHDDPIAQEVGKLIKTSDVIFLNIKEVEEEEPEPRYFLWDGVEAIKGIGREDETIHPTCEDCFCDACFKYLWGPYCVAAVERYFEENHYIANERDAYVIYVAHFNRRLDAHSYDDSGNAEQLRPTQITRPPRCMREGSLSHCIKWIKWQRRCGPHSEWYASQRRRRQRSRQTSEAKEQMDNRGSQMN